MGKHTTQSKLRILKIYLADLESGKKIETQPSWLKEILVRNGTIKGTK